MLSPIKLGQVLDVGAVSAASVTPTTPTPRGMQQDLSSRDWRRHYSEGMARI